MNWIDQLCAWKITKRKSNKGTSPYEWQGSRFMIETNGSRAPGTFNWEWSTLMGTKMRKSSNFHFNHTHTHTHTHTAQSSSLVKIIGNRQDCDRFKSIRFELIHNDWNISLFHYWNLMYFLLYTNWHFVSSFWLKCLFRTKKNEGRNWYSTLAFHKT